MSQMLNNAIVLAAIHHADQYDHGGRPYVLHVLKVMHYLKSDDEELNCIAVLHDIIEDCKQVTYGLLIAQGMSDRVIAGVKALTRVPGQTEQEYQAGVLANRDAMQVKLCDLRHNMDVRRLKGLRQKDFERMEKYVRFYHEIEQTLKCNQ